MSEAVDALEKQKQEIIDSCTRRVAELDNWIATIRAQEAKQGGKGTMFVDIPVRSNQYKGLKAGIALHAYLAERGGGPIKIDRVTKDLIEGGANLGTAKDGRGIDRRPRVVRNTITNNRQFRYADRGETMVELADRISKSA